MNVSIQQLSTSQRQTILYLEAAALLHDIGKLSNGFLGEKTGEWRYQNYHYDVRVDIQKLFPHLFQTPITEKKLRELVQAATAGAAENLTGQRPDITPSLEAATFTSWNGESYNLAETVAFAAPWAANVDWQPLLNRSLQPAKLIGYLHGIAHYEKPSVSGRINRNYLKLCRATPFGYETPINQGLDPLLAQLPLAETKDVIVPTARQAWLTQMRQLLKQGIADTQLSINDVSLWHWGYTVAALTKAAAYQIYAAGWPDNLGQLAFRTLVVQLDLLSLYSRSDKVTDLLGVRDAVNTSFNAVRQLLEVQYGLGNQLYRDHTGSYFLLPDVADIAELAAEIRSLFDGDLQPQVYLHAERVTLGALDSPRPAVKAHAVAQMLTGPRAAALENGRYPIHSDNNLVTDEAMWTSDRPENAGICTVCRHHPIGYPPNTMNEAMLRQQGHTLSDSWATTSKARERNICRYCLRRRGRRSSDWLANGMTQTIWADEVADNNGRLALIAGALKLDDWLNGKLVATLMDGNPDNALFSKTASPARIFHMAETARDFWETITSDTVVATIDQRPYRLSLTPSTPRGELDLGHAHAYELEIDRFTLGVVYDRPGHRFVTAENLADVVRRWPGVESLEELPERLLHSRVTVREPSQFLRPGSALQTITITNVETLDAYTPAISLLAEPGLGMLLVPADEALPLAEKIHEIYLQQMGRVADRLPLHLGIVYFPRRTPLTAVLEAGRRFLQMRADWEAWQVAARDDETVTFRKNKQTFVHRYSRRMADGSAPDAFYPYLPLRDPDSADLSAPGTLKHVSQLQPGDTVYIRPGYFDFEFLDTVGRLAEIHYGTDGRRLTRQSRPYLLPNLATIESLWQGMRHLKVTQRHQVVRSIEDARERWFAQNPANAGQDQTFAAFVRDTLTGAAWPRAFRRRADFSQIMNDLTAAGISGLLTDLAELHMKILKEKSGPVEQQQEVMTA